MTDQRIILIVLATLSAIALVGGMLLELDSAFTLAIDQHWYQAFNVEEFADALSGFDIEAAYAPAIIETIVRNSELRFVVGLLDFQFLLFTQSRLFRDVLAHLEFHRG